MTSPRQIREIPAAEWHDLVVDDDRFWNSVDEMIDHYEQEGLDLPPFVLGTSPRYLSFTLPEIIEAWIGQREDEQPEDYEQDDIHNRIPRAAWDDLTAALQKFNAEMKGKALYWIEDRSVRVLLPPVPAAQTDGGAS